jgi:hypothetical protein
VRFASHEICHKEWNRRLSSLRQDRCFLLKLLVKSCERSDSARGRRHPCPDEAVYSSSTIEPSSKDNDSTFGSQALESHPQFARRARPNWTLQRTELHTPLSLSCAATICVAAHLGNAVSKTESRRRDAHRPESANRSRSASSFRGTDANFSKKRAKTTRQMPANCEEILWCGTYTSGDRLKSLERHADSIYNEPGRSHSWEISITTTERKRRSKRGGSRAGTP